MIRLLIFVSLLFSIQSSIYNGSISALKKEHELNCSPKFTYQDSLKLAEFWQMVTENNLSNTSITDIELFIAQWFLGSSYVAGTLDQNIEEKLVVNLHEFDCVTFVENVLALTFCATEGDLSKQQYFQNLKTIRYRNGIIEDYSSRLHYFTDWLLNNQQKGILTIVSNSLGDANFDATVNIMSKNSDKNTHLTDNATLTKIIDVEKSLSKVELRFITQDKIEQKETLINNGDIIAITSTINGLDIGHVGIAKHYGGRLHIIHASSARHKVILSEIPLADYIKQKDSFNGILVARLNQ